MLFISLVVGFGFVGKDGINDVLECEMAPSRVLATAESPARALGPVPLVAILKVCCPFWHLFPAPGYLRPAF